MKGSEVKGNLLSGSVFLNPGDYLSLRGNGGVSKGLIQMQEGTKILEKQ